MCPSSSQQRAVEKCCSPRKFVRDSVPRDFIRDRSFRYPLLLYDQVLDSQKKRRYSKNTILRHSITLLPGREWWDHSRNPSLLVPVRSGIQSLEDQPAFQIDFLGRGSVLGHLCCHNSILQTEQFIKEGIDLACDSGRWCWHLFNIWKDLLSAACHDRRQCSHPSQGIWRATLSPLHGQQHHLLEVLPFSTVVLETNFPTHAFHGTLMNTSRQLLHFRPEVKFLLCTTYCLVFPTVQLLIFCPFSNLSNNK